MIRAYKQNRLQTFKPNLVLNSINFCTIKLESLSLFPSRKVSIEEREISHPDAISDEEDEKEGGSAGGGGAPRRYHLHGGLLPPQ